MSFPIYVVDAFTIGEKAFTGNPAAVCLLEYDDDISDEEKQLIAMEMNLSETAFVSFGWTKGVQLPFSEDNSTINRTLRWFTPSNEIPLCGHATVGSATIVRDVQLLANNASAKNIAFASKFRGQLGATLEEDGSISLNFPSNPPRPLSEEGRPWLEDMILKTLGSISLRKDVQDVQYSPGTKILLLRLKDALGPDGLKKVKPNCAALLEINTEEFIRDIIVTVKGDDKNLKGPHFYSRCFAPWEGIDEDPVTGLAHTVLTPYWTKELSGVGGVLKARQHSARGGDVSCMLMGDRVKLAGQSKRVLEGTINLK